MGLFGERRAFMTRLSAADRTALLALGRRHAYAPREHLVGEGERSGFVVVILTGWCAVRRSTERGELILALRQDGELVGEMAALDHRPRSATVSAIGPVEGLVVPGERFRAFMSARPYVTGLVMAQLTERLRSADDERRALASATVLERLAARLVELAERTGRPGPEGGSVAIRLPLSQSELAAAVGATREAVAKALRLLREEGLVSTRPGAIVVSELAPLRLLGGADVSDVGDGSDISDGTRSEGGGGR
jgi:CRP/FNR family transcriptional regulator, cyclic AMP receptor protein